MAGPTATRIARAAGSCLALLLAAAASQAQPHVARASLRGGDASGSVFFLRADAPGGAVAVGAAHSFELARLAESVEIAFRVPGREAPVATSTRYWARPGRAYHAAGSSMREDHVSFALAEAPVGVRILEPAGGEAAPGARVRIIGWGEQALGETAIFGQVVRRDARRIEVDLDAVTDLRGFGGAPVLDDATGRVLGLVQAAWPAEGRMRVGIGPIAGAAEAIAAPLDDGLGRLFATLAPEASAANSPATRRRLATGSAHGDASQAAARTIEQALRLEPAPPASDEPVVLELDVEYPPEGTTVGDAGTAFVAGRALARRGIFERFDLIIVLDTSESTRGPAGHDVDGDGQLGQAIESGPDKGTSNDAGDSILAAEISAAARLIAGLDPRRTRVGIVTFSGLARPRDPFGRLPPEIVRAALTLEPLTSDYDRILRALGSLRLDHAIGMTHIAAGVDQATLELLGLPGALSAGDPLSRKLVLFLTDGQPTLPMPNADGVNIRAVLDASHRARRGGVRIHSFAIGPEALSGPASTVEMAAITAGLFTPVRDPGRLERFIDTVNFAEVERVEVRNRTMDRSAHHTRLHADGSFDALVPLAPGENRIEVRAFGSDGAERVAERRVQFVPGQASPTLPAELVGKRGELLRGRLAALEHERIETMRKELVIEIERERAAAEQRASRQLKILEIEVERESPPARDGG